MNARLFLVVVVALALGFLTITSPIWWTGIFAAGVWVAIVAAGSWLPMAIGGNLPADADAMWGEAKSAEMARWLALTMAGGIGAAIAIWTLSMYALGTIVPGVGVTLGMAAWGLVRAARHRPIIAARIRAIDWPFATATVITLALALGFTMYDVWWGDVVLVPPTSDIAVHIYMAQMVRQFGLPLVNLLGDPGLQTTTHVGTAVWLNGISPLAESTIQLARASFIFMTLAIVWTFFGLLGTLAKHAWLWVLAAILPNFWGVAPTLYQIFKRDSLSSILFPVPDTYFPSRAGIFNFTNLPEGMVMAIGAASLIIFSKWIRERVTREKGSRALGVFCLLTVIGFAIKPNLFIIFMPAIVVFLFLIGGRPIEWGIAVVSFGLGFLFFLIPQWLFTAPDVQSEVAINDASQIVSRGLRLSITIWPIILLSVGASLVLRLIRRKRAFDVVDFLVIGIAGATAFFCVFKMEMSNEAWPLFALTSIIAPFVIAWPWIENRRQLDSTWDGSAKSGWRRGMVYLFYFFAFLHLYAAPFIAADSRFAFANSRETVVAVKDLGQILPKSATVLIDPILFKLEKNLFANGLPVYLNRLVLWGPSAAQHEIELHHRWNDMFVEEKLLHPEIIDSRNAVLLRSGHASWLVSYLTSQNWQLQKSQGGLDLWVNANTHN